MVPGNGLCRALGTIVLVYLLAPRSVGISSGHTLILAGVVVSTVLGSVLMFVVSIAPSEAHAWGSMVALGQPASP